MMEIIANIEEVILMSQKEIFIPDCLKQSVENYLKNENTTLWDCYYCELQTDINVAEIEGMITSEEAWELRKEFLGLKREG
jgi:hypothetical protein